MFTCLHTKQWSLADGRKKCAACRRVLPADHRKWGPGNLPENTKKALLEAFLKDESAYSAHMSLDVSRPTAERFFRILRERCAASCNASKIYLRVFSFYPRRFENLTSSSMPAANRTAQRFAAFGIRYRRAFDRIEIFDLNPVQLAHVKIQAGADIAKGKPQVIRLSPHKIETFDSAYLELHRSNTVLSVPPGTDKYFRVPTGNHKNRKIRSAAFWSFAAYKLARHHMIPAKYLSMYLAEMAWKYNHRGLTPHERIQVLLADSLQ